MFFFLCHLLIGIRAFPVEKAQQRDIFCLLVNHCGRIPRCESWGKAAFPFFQAKHRRSSLWPPQKKDFTKIATEIIQPYAKDDLGAYNTLRNPYFRNSQNGFPLKDKATAPAHDDFEQSPTAKFGHALFGGYKQ